MGTVASVTTSIPLDYPNHSTVARDPVSGYLYLYGKVSTTDTRVWRSTDGGSTWTTFTTVTHTGQVEWSSIVIDRAGFLHVAYRFSDASFDRLYYRRLHLASASWVAHIQVSGTNGSGDANGGVAGGFWQGVDLAVVRHSDGSYSIAVVGASTYTGVKYGVIVHGVSIDRTGRAYLNNGLISGNRSYQVAGTAPGRSSPSCDIHHTGDGITTSTPHLWIAWGRTKLYMVRLAWTGRGWQTPATLQTIDSSIPASDYVNGRWDGTRWLMCVVDTDDTTTADIYERNAANSATTVRQTPQHPAGVIRTLAISYDSTNKNIRVFAVGTSSTLLYYVDFVRATSLWGAWATVSADPLNSASPPDEFTVRRGGTSGNARFDLVYTTGSGTPWTIKSVHLLQNYSPTAPTWDTSGVSFSNGTAADVGAALALSWRHNDPNPSDTQSAYALSRQIGAGTINYWNAGSSTWGVTEVFNTSGTNGVTLSSGWGAGTDANHTYRVRTRDSGALDSPYSSSLVLTPSVKVNPVFVTPTAAQILTTDYVTVSWTAAEQKQWRIWLVTNPGGVTMYDSGWRTDAVTSFVPPYDLADNSGWTVWLATTNNEGLASTTQTRNFTVDYIEAPVPTVASTPVPASGWVSATVTNPAAVGAQPAVQSVDVWRRVATGAATINSNPDFAGNVTGYIVGGGGTPGTLSYSTTQFVTAPGAARYVPAGSGSPAPFPQVESATYVIDATKPLHASAWVRADTISKPVTININWYDSGINYLSSTSASVNPGVAGVWLYLTVVGDPATIPSAARASVGAGLSGTPLPADAIYIDELRLRVHNEDPGIVIGRTLSANATVQDWKAAARTNYEYQAVAHGANGSHVTGPWQS